MRLVMLGPPGAGKGTQAVRLATHFRCGHVSTGDIFREHVANETPLGRTAQEYMDAGDLVPDEVVIAMVTERLAERDCFKGFVLDRFPRTVGQAEALDEWLESAGSPLDAALFFEIDEEELFRRLAGRSAALHRSDDREQTIRHRLEVFAAKTRPLVDLDKRAEHTIRDAGAVPSFLGYHGFPATLCLSPNDGVVHGIPNGYVLREGDILSID